MSSVLVYDFIDSELTNAILIINPLTRNLVFVALGKSKPQLLQDAKLYVKKLKSPSPPGSKYILKNKQILRKEDDSWFQQICSDFLLTLLSPSGKKVEINCEYLSGTEFQKKVWEATKRIPPGTTVSYQSLAKQIGHPTAVRAVASALARNNIAVIIPCHRVIGITGRMSGFRWGIPLKESLLEREKSLV